MQMSSQQNMKQLPSQTSISPTHNSTESFPLKSIRSPSPQVSPYISHGSSVQQTDSCAPVSQVAASSTFRPLNDVPFFLDDNADIGSLQQDITHQPEEHYDGIGSDGEDIAHFFTLPLRQYESRDSLCEDNHPLQQRPQHSPIEPPRDQPQSECREAPHSRPPAERFLHSVDHNNGTSTLPPIASSSGVGRLHGRQSSGNGYGNSLIAPQAHINIIETEMRAGSAVSPKQFFRDTPEQLASHPMRSIPSDGCAATIPSPSNVTTNSYVGAQGRYHPLADMRPIHSPRNPANGLFLRPIPSPPTSSGTREQSPKGHATHRTPAPIDESSPRHRPPLHPQAVPNSHHNNHLPAESNQILGCKPSSLHPSYTNRLSHRRKAMHLAREDHYRTLLASLPLVKSQFDTYRKVMQQWENATAKVANVPGGICIYVILPYLERVQLDLVPRKPRPEPLFGIQGLAEGKEAMGKAWRACKSVWYRMWQRESKDKQGQKRPSRPTLAQLELSREDDHVSPPSVAPGHLESNQMKQGTEGQMGAVVQDDEKIVSTGGQLIPDNIQPARGHPTKSPVSGSVTATINDSTEMLRRWTWTVNIKAFRALRSTSLQIAQDESWRQQQQHIVSGSDHHTPGSDHVRGHDRRYKPPRSDPYDAPENAQYIGQFELDFASSVEGPQDTDTTAGMMTGGAETDAKASIPTSTASASASAPPIRMSKRSLSHRYNKHTGLLVVYVDEIQQILLTDDEEDEDTEEGLHDGILSRTLSKAMSWTSTPGHSPKPRASRGAFHSSPSPSNYSTVDKDEERIVTPSPQQHQPELQQQQRHEIHMQATQDSTRNGDKRRLTQRPQLPPLHTEHLLDDHHAPFLQERSPQPQYIDQTFSLLSFPSTSTIQPTYVRNNPPNHHHNTYHYSNSHNTVHRNDNPNNHHDSRSRHHAQANPHHFGEPAPSPQHLLVSSTQSSFYGTSPQALQIGPHGVYHLFTPRNAQQQALHTHNTNDIRDEHHVQGAGYGFAGTTNTDRKVGSTGQIQSTFRDGQATDTPDQSFQIEDSSRPASAQSDDVASSRSSTISSVTFCADDDVSLATTAMPLLPPVMMSHGAQPPPPLPLMQIQAFTMEQQHRFASASPQYQRQHQQEHMQYDYPPDNTTAAHGLLSDGQPHTKGDSPDTEQNIGRDPNQAYVENATTRDHNSNTTDGDTPMIETSKDLTQRKKSPSKKTKEKSHQPRSVPTTPETTSPSSRTGIRLPALSAFASLPRHPSPLPPSARRASTPSRVIRTTSGSSIFMGASPSATMTEHNADNATSPNKRSESPQIVDSPMVCIASTDILLAEELDHSLQLHQQATQRDVLEVGSSVSSTQSIGSDPQGGNGSEGARARSALSSHSSFSISAAIHPWLTTSVVDGVAYAADDDDTDTPNNVKTTE